MPSSDFAFANDIRAAAALRTPRTSRMLLFAFLAMLVAFLTWAHFAILDEVKRGNGRVVPSRQTQVVQTPRRRYRRRDPRFRKAPSFSRVNP